MAFFARDVQDIIVRHLQSHNTNTATPIYISKLVSQSGGRDGQKIKQVVRGTPRNTPKAIQALPCVWVALDTNDTTPDNLGPDAPFRMDMGFELVIAAKSPSPLTQDHDEAERIAAILADNIFELFRRDTKMSNTVAWIWPTQIDYNADIPGAAFPAYVSATQVILEGFTLAT